MQRLSGSKPGLIDPGQLTRLLRDPEGSKLSFASFNPFVASADSGVPNLRDLSINNHGHRPKRIVLETLSTGEVFWRFVPKARTAVNVEDEGAFPRTVSIEGTLYECSQEQWDIYKLDPGYDCFIPAPPQIPLITKVDATEGTPSVKPFSKRPVRSPTPENDTLDSRPKKRSFGVEVKTIPESDEDQHGPDMSIDPEIPRRPALGKARKFRLATERSREERRQQNMRRDERLKSGGPDMDYEMNDAGPSAFRRTKRKAASVFGAAQNHHDPIFMSPDENSDEPGRTATYTNGNGRSFKRTRTVSPQATQRDLEMKRLERERRKRQRLQAEDKTRKDQRDHQSMEDILAHIKQYTAANGETTSATGKVDDPLVVDEENSDEAARRAAIDESRRKLAELERDRPLWEEESEKRKRREQEEENQRRSAAEERKRTEAKRLEEERLKRAELEARLETEREEARKQAKEQRQRSRQQEKNRWSYGPWTSQRALERYRSLCDTFDTSKFSEENPLSFDDVPWPVLHSPATLTVDDIDWNAVEQFFQAVRPHMRSQDYKTFVEKSHRRFHPDRWRSRRLLISIMDETERNYVELATTVVSQALTPIWRSAKC